MFYLRFQSVWRLYLVVHITSGTELKNILLGEKYKLIDLTLPLNNWSNDFEILENGTALQFPRIPGEGTHIESPYYVEQGIHISKIPTEKLMVQLIIIDVSSEVKHNPDYVLSMDDLNSSLNKEVLTQMSLWPSLMVIKFGWSKYYNEDPKNVGYAKGSDSHNTPAIGSEVMERLTKCEMCKNVVGIGTDLPSLYTRNNGTAADVHNVLSKSSLYIIKGLRLHDSLSVTECVALLSPKKTQEEATVPITVFTICPKELYNANNAVRNEQNRKKRALGIIGNVVEDVIFEKFKHKHMGCGHHAHKNEDSTETHISASTEGNTGEKQESLPQKIIGGSLDIINDKIKDKIKKILP